MGRTHSESSSAEMVTVSTSHTDARTKEVAPVSDIFEREKPQHLDSGVGIRSTFYTISQAKASDSLPSPLGHGPYARHAQQPALK